MDNKEFKVVFGDVAKENSFERAFGGWFKEGPKCIVVLDLQKSNYSDYFYMNAKVFVQGAFGNHYVRNKDLVKKGMGYIYTRAPNEFADVFNLGIVMDDAKREERLRLLFKDFVVPFAEKAMSIAGIYELEAANIIFITDPVKKELNRLTLDK